jgi:hypothetical protein
MSSSARARGMPRSLNTYRRSAPSFLGMLPYSLAETQKEWDGCGFHTGHEASSRADSLAQRAKCQLDCGSPSVT